MFAQEIASRIDAGRADVDGLGQELDALQQQLQKAAAQDERLAARCSQVIPTVPDALMASARGIAGHHHRIAAGADNTATLGALQFGDITRPKD